MHVNSAILANVLATDIPITIQVLVVANVLVLAITVFALMLAVTYLVQMEAFRTFIRLSGNCIACSHDGQCKHYCQRTDKQPSSQHTHSSLLLIF